MITSRCRHQPVRSATLVVALLIHSAVTHAFSSISPFTSIKLKRGAASQCSALIPVGILESMASISFNDESPSLAVEAARQKFWFYFFAGSGAGGIGIAQLPAVFRDVEASRSVVGKGPTRGGESLNAGPLLGVYYSSELALNDVLDAIEKAPSAEYITSRSQSQNYMASKGYIERRDFIKEMDVKGCNPLSSYALYDAISSGKGDVVSPVIYDEKLAEYRQGTSSASGGLAGTFVRDLNGFLAVKTGAFIGLVFCLFVDFGFIAKAGIEGFFS